MVRASPVVGATADRLLRPFWALASATAKRNRCSESRIEVAQRPPPVRTETRRDAIYRVRPDKCARPQP